MHTSYVCRRMHCGECTETVQVPYNSSVQDYIMCRRERSSGILIKWRLLQCTITVLGRYNFFFLQRDSVFEGSRMGQTLNWHSCTFSRLCVSHVE